MKSPEARTMALNDRGVISLRFNQDHSCFACCMQTGLRIYNLDPLVEKAFTGDDALGSLSQCEMLYRSNMLAVTAGGSQPQFAPNTVLLFDDISKKFVMDLTFMAPVKAVRLRRDRIIVATLNQIHVFSFPTPCRRLLTIDTRENPLGLCEVTPMLNPEKLILIFPGHKQGSIQVVDLNNTEVGTSSAPVNINAHQGELACLAINQQGTLVATASDKGTLIRVWDTVRKVMAAEFRRGSDYATVYCMNFSSDSEFFCCASDKGTVHIYAVKDLHLNRRSSFSKLPIVSTYGDSMWGLAHFTVPPECACICAFGSKRSVVAICVDGSFHKYVFNTGGGCYLKSYDVFLDVCGTDEF